MNSDFFYQKITISLFQNALADPGGEFEVSVWGQLGACDIFKPK
jgi:hypothetical protein